MEKCRNGVAFTMKQNGNTRALATSTNIYITMRYYDKYASYETVVSPIARQKLYVRS